MRHGTMNSLLVVVGSFESVEFAVCMHDSNRMCEVARLAVTA
jgi:hypothetical protein